MKIYKAIVWIGDEPGRRVEVVAVAAGDAGEKLRDEFGDEAIFSAWNEQDAQKPR